MIVGPPNSFLVAPVLSIFKSETVEEKAGSWPSTDSYQGRPDRRLNQFHFNSPQSVQHAVL